MAMASLRREGKRLLLPSRLSSKSPVPARSAILSDMLEPAGVHTISTHAVNRWMHSAKSIQEIKTLNVQSTQVPTGYAVIGGCSSPVAPNLRCAFSSSVNQLPAITDPDVEAALKDLLAINWDEIPDTIVNQTKKALSKATEDKAGQAALANVFRAAEASAEFSGVLVSLRMALDDLCGFSGENVGHLPEHVEDAVRAAHKKYIAYLDSFGPDETFLKKKVELELGTKMIHLKMRCSGIGSEWGKVTLLGTSGLSGSYVELRS